MIGRWLRRLLVLGTLGGAGWVAVKFLRGDPVPAFEAGPTTPTLLAPVEKLVPTPSPPAEATVVEPEAPAAEPEAPAAPAAPVADWVDAVAGEDGPATHPVKAKLKSGIYHLPGMLNYDRTVPDRWYTTAEAAEADALRQAKR